MGDLSVSSHWQYDDHLWLHAIFDSEPMMVIYEKLLLECNKMI